MPELSPDELTALRSQIPTAAKVNWYLALAPYGDPCFTAQVNNFAAAKGDRDIIYDNDVGEANVQAGMTLWVGDDPGLYNVGKVRIRSINVGANTITVAENDDIAWADGLHLTCPGVQGFRELWGVYPRITEVGGVVAFYEDYDELYNDPVDDVLPPKANASAPVCQFMLDDGYADVAFVGDQSFTTELPPAAIVAYAWNFADGVVQVGGVNQAGTCDDPNVVRFATPGFRYVSLTVTDNAGRTGTVYVPVWIFDRQAAPPLSVEVLNQSADPSWRLTVRAYVTQAAAQDVVYNYPDGALAVLFHEAEWPDGSVDVGGECYRSNIRFVGWLDGESLTYDYNAGTVQFSAVSHDLRLRQLPGFAYTLEDDATPGDWYEVNDLTVDRALHAHLERRTTVNQVCHVETMAETNRTVSIQAFPDASLYDQAQQHLLKDAMCAMLSDRQGILRVRRDPQFMDAVDRNGVEVVAPLTGDDILNEVDLTRPHQDQIGYVRLGGFAYETPLLSEAPGVAPSQSEVATYTEGFVVEDQAELNLWTALWWEKANAPFKDVPLEMAGYWPVFDPAMQEYVELTATDRLDRNVFDEDRFIVRKVTFGDRARDGTSTTNLVVEKEAPLSLGETVTIPPPPPPESPPPPPEIPVVTIPTPTFALVHDRGEIYSTNDFDALNPTWTNITGAIVGTIFSVEVDQFDGIGAWAVTGSDNVSANDVGNTVGVWRTNDVTVGAPVWNLVFTQLQGSLNRAAWSSCDGFTPRPAWGQMRSVVPYQAGVCVVPEVRWHGLTAWVPDVTTIFQVDNVGAFATLNGVLGYSLGCGSCSATAPCNPGVPFFEFGWYCNQHLLYPCHQAYYSGGLLMFASMYHWRDADEYCHAAGCVCGCPGCRYCQLMPYHPDIAPLCGVFLNGVTHTVYCGGRKYGQTQQSTAGAPGGALYSDADGELDDDLWSNYAFCNICSHSNHYYYCKQINAIVARTNELYVDGAASGVTSDLLFGGNGVGYNAGVIGHIRAIWDEDQTVVLVRKDQPDGLQPNTQVVWTYDPVNGLQDKTGNLAGIQWWGTGARTPPGIPWAQALDNVGFSAFGVPLR